jgi:hypothetical protein
MEIMMMNIKNYCGTQDIKNSNTRFEGELLYGDTKSDRSKRSVFPS